MSEHKPKNCAGIANHELVEEVFTGPAKALRQEGSFAQNKNTSTSRGR